MRPRCVDCNDARGWPSAPGGAGEAADRHSRQVEDGCPSVELDRRRVPAGIRQLRLSELVAATGPDEGARTREPGRGSRASQAACQSRTTRPELPVIITSNPFRNSRYGKWWVMT